MIEAKPVLTVPKRSRARNRSTRSDQAKAQPKLTTYSIRLTQPERALLEKALTATGWTATNFLTRTTLERAAHIENTRRPISIDFDNTARRCAQGLCKPEAWFSHDEHRDEPDVPWQFLKQNLEDLSNWQLTMPAPIMSTSDMAELRKASKHGGSEFWAKVLDECDRLVASDRSNLPPPIDPETLE